jgi:hypothetical protein
MCVSEMLSLIPSTSPLELEIGGCFTWPVLEIPSRIARH